MGKNKVYWRGYEELHESEDFMTSKNKEFAEEIPVDEFLNDESASKVTTNRRDFLKYLGFSVTAASLAACETPVQRTIPYVVKPTDITPGVPNYYASTYFDGIDYAGVLVKTREGRPIKITGNNLSPLTKGSTSASIQGSILSLYDTKRARTALKNGKPVSWAELDSEVAQKLKSFAAKSEKVVLLTSTINSPSTLQVIAKFQAKYPNVQHIQYDAVSYAAIREANKKTLGKSIIPEYRFDKAEAIVSFAADFLNGWLMNTAYEKQYAEGRQPAKKRMSRHFQYESLMSPTGTNADYRVPASPTETKHAIVALYNALAKKSGKSGGASVKLNKRLSKSIADAANYLWKHKKAGLVVCGLNDTDAQLAVNKINELLGSYGHTIKTNKAVNIYQGNDAQVAQMVKEMKSGKIKGLLCYQTNPAYTLPNSKDFIQGLTQVPLSLSFNDRIDETSTKYLAPDHHFLEAWNDYQPIEGEYSLQQPTIRPLFDTRAMQESLLVWAGAAIRGDKATETYREFIQNYWTTKLYPLQSRYTGKTDFWNYSLYDGVFSTKKRVEPLPETTNKQPQIDSLITTIADGAKTALPSSAIKKLASAKQQGGWDVLLYTKSGIGQGQHAANPILQEFPDPVTRITWDNYITMAPADMEKPEFDFNKEMGQHERANVAKVELNGSTIELPVVAAPGQKPGTVGIALGYGRKFGDGDKIIGKNAYPMVDFENNKYQNNIQGAKISRTDKRQHIASIQTHHTMMGRPLIKETSYKEYLKNPASGNADNLMHTSAKDIWAEKGHNTPSNVGEAHVEDIDYWKDFVYPNHHWSLSIDLNSCTGCGSCVVSCSLENNVPVVGKDEIRRTREMHWLRIDRYYSSDADPSTRYERGNDKYKAKEIPSDHPTVAYQPIMCQHCNDAPCETVCPVVATTHSHEGLNQMTYNRCVGTRYCANNCPYKVRRFNWFRYHNNDKFDYYMNNDLGKMVLNPDVTVRARGVMEKCSMCIQRIQAGKLQAKKEERMVNDGDILTACQDACPTNAIVFGDLNNKKSRNHKTLREPRTYFLLETLGTQPNVFYQTKIRNVDEAYGHKAPEHGSAKHSDKQHKKNAKHSKPENKVQEETHSGH